MKYASHLFRKIKLEDTLLEWIFKLSLNKPEIFSKWRTYKT